MTTIQSREVCQNIEMVVIIFGSSLDSVEWGVDMESV